MLYLPIQLLGRLRPGPVWIGRCNRFQGVIRTAKGMLWDMGRSHRLPDSPRGKAGGIVPSGVARGGMGRKRRSANNLHRKNAGPDPFTAYEQGRSGAMILWMRPLKKGKHPFGAPGGPDSQQFMIDRGKFFHRPFSHHLMVRPVGGGGVPVGGMSHMRFRIAALVEPMQG
jgi:hypothetical protein